MDSVRSPTLTAISADSWSRRGHVFKSWPCLATELAHAMRCRSAVIDGEIVCLGPDGKSQFYNLLFLANGRIHGVRPAGAERRRPQWREA